MNEKLNQGQKNGSSAGENESSFKHDAFISYSRKDKVFAALLERTLEATKIPVVEGWKSKKFDIFRDEEDFTGTEYHSAIRRHLINSKSLIVICSPSAKASPFVNEEIKIFANEYGVERIVPVLIDGIPNNEAALVNYEYSAFPDELMARMEMPLAVIYKGVDVSKGKINKKPYLVEWYSLMANMLGVPRDVVEQREKRRRAQNVKKLSFAVFVGLCVIAASGLNSWIRENKLSWSLFLQARMGFLDWIPEMRDVPLSDGFFMGGADEKHAQPEHFVKISKKFAIAKSEVTVRQYKDFASFTGTPLANVPPADGDDWPVVGVSWEDARDYARWLSALTGNSYRLPTESEWEYSARGAHAEYSNFSDRYWWGEDKVDGVVIANCVNCNSQWSGVSSAPVGSFRDVRPNNKSHPLNLWDTVGNVSEWVEDCWHDSYANAPSMQVAWGEEDEGDCALRVLRGGDYSTELENSTAASRDALAWNLRGVFRVGFRLVEDR